MLALNTMALRGRRKVGVQGDRNQALTTQGQVGQLLFAFAIEGTHFTPQAQFDNINVQANKQFGTRHPTTTTTF